MDVPPWLVHVPLSCQTSHNTAMCSTHTTPAYPSKNVTKRVFFPSITICASAACSVLNRCLVKATTGMYLLFPVN